MFPTISSVQNQRIKQLVQLREKSRTRKKAQLFIIEGIQETILAHKGGYEIVELYVCEEILDQKNLAELTELLPKEIAITNLSLTVYQKIAYRTSTEGVIAISRWKNNDISNLKIHTSTPLVLIAEAPEKPGNIGALLRTADAAGVDAVIIANPKTDLYNPNIIRSSVGCVFTTNLAMGNTDDIIFYLNKNHISIYSAILQEAVTYTTPDYRKASAIVLGTEHDGLSETWRKAATKNIKIPMHGQVDSMNVSVAAGILIFEAKRQRSY